jgi:hypothetical protein
MTTTQTTLVSRKTRKGAVSYIENSLLGYSPDEWFEDDYWNGQRRVPVRVRFTVVERGPKDFAVVREVEKNEEN